MYCHQLSVIHIKIASNSLVKGGGAFPDVVINNYEKFLYCRNKLPDSIHYFILNFYHHMNKDFNTKIEVFVNSIILIKLL